ncbi:unnamed protein product [Callosobruchus maculatus]|uniref:Uncharacterized protein n=1 Tax=Callosobruchus maculatus TaxID=64391 RepID=A0A653BP87_CALMS|nr:unnamed protein product [Callosobruchus maculatus]
MGNLKPDKEVMDFVSGYKKYWSEHKDNGPENPNEGQQKEPSQEISMNGANKEKVIKNTEETGLENKRKRKNSLQKEETQEKEYSLKVSMNGTNKEKVKETAVNTALVNKKKRKNSLQKDNMIHLVPKLDEEITSRVDSKNKKKDRVNIASVDAAKNKKQSKIQKLNVSSTSDWDVEDVFEILEEDIKKKVAQKAKQIEKRSTKKANKVPKAKKEEKKIDLSMPSRSKKHIIDEEMLETPKSTEATEENSSVSSGLNRLKEIIDATEVNTEVNINPQQFLNVKTTHLDTAIPDFATTDENEEETVTGQKDLIMEAFEDDDIATDFNKEKAEEIDKDTPKDIDLNLPGWGSWAGANIDSSKRKRKRFIIKMPPQMPRKDSNKGTLIINEKAEKKIKPLLVSEVPFPFKSVKDYEASIRAPIGNNWVPETAFRRFIEPAVITKIGAIIEPISKSMLVGQKKVY